METDPRRRSSLRRSSCSPAEAGETDVRCTHNLQNQPTVHFSGRAEELGIHSLASTLAGGADKNAATPACKALVTANGVS